MPGPASVGQSDGSAGKRALQAPWRTIHGAENRSRPGSYPQVKQAAFQKILTFAPVQNMSFVGGNSTMMTPKQERFVQEYLIDLNATQAAIRAGYSKKTAQEQSARLLSKVIIQEAVQIGRAKLAKKTELSAEWVLLRLQEVAERCLQRVPVMRFDRIEKCMAQAVDPDTGEGIFEFDASGANRALELIGKHLGMFIDKHDLIVREGLSERMRRAEERLTAGKRGE